MRVSLGVDDLYPVNKHLSLDLKLRLGNADANRCFCINTVIGLLHARPA